MSTILHAAPAPAWATASPWRDGVIEHTVRATTVPTVQPECVGEVAPAVEVYATQNDHLEAGTETVAIYREAPSVFVTGPDATMVLDVDQARLLAVALLEVVDAIGDQR